MNERDPEIRRLIGELGTVAPTPHPFADIGVPRTVRSPTWPGWSYAVLAAAVALTFVGGVAVGYWLWGGTKALPAADDGHVGVAEQRTGSSTAVCPAGSSPDEPGPPDQTRPTGSDWEQGAFDRQSGRLVILAPSPTHTGMIWTFDVCTNTWEEMGPASEPPSDYGLLVYDAGSDLTISISPDSVMAYDLETNTWTEKTPPPSPGLLGIVGAYDDRADLVVLVDKVGDTRTYDVDADSWTKRSSPGFTSGVRSQLMVYDRSLGRIVVWVEESQNFSQTWTYDTIGDRWERLDIDTKGIHTGYGVTGGLFAHHEGSGRSMMYANGEYAFFDSAVESWEYRFEFERVEDTSLDRWSHALVYDPVNDRILMFGGEARLSIEEWTDVDDVWAYDPIAHEWTLLLAPSQTAAG